MCTPLATATGLLTLLVSFCSQDASASVDVLSLYYCTIVLTCMLHLPLQSPMSTSYFHLLTSLSARGFHLVLLTCIELLYCIVLLHCLVYLHLSLPSPVSTGFTLLLTHMSACVFVFLLQEGRFTLYYNLLLAY